MHFILSKDHPEVTENLVQYIRNLPLNKKVIVEIKEYRRNRSLAQNRLMWMWYGPIAEYVGDTPEEIHEHCKASILGFETVTIPHMIWKDKPPVGGKFGEIIIAMKKLAAPLARFLGFSEETFQQFLAELKQDGEITYQRPRSTTGLSVEKMTEYLHGVESLAAHLNISLPYPQDYAYLMGYEQKGTENGNQATV